MSKDVLFVSWCPLDLLRPRALQVGRAAKALRLGNWRPHLICAQFENDVDLFDPEIEGWYRPSFAEIMAFNDPAFMDQSAAPPEGARDMNLLSRLRPLLGKPKRPEPWVDAATRAVARWSRRRLHPIVVSFGQPWTSHLAVLAAKRSGARLRWAAHFSDPWVDNPYLRGKEGSEFESARAQEREIIEQADAVVFVTEDTADLVMRKYPAEWRRKVRVIPHFLDLDQPLPPHAGKSDRLRLVHTGSLYHGARAPNGLFGAFRDLLRRTPLDLPLTFRFVGWVPDGTIDSIRDVGVRDCISWTTPLYYSPCLKEMADADVLVVIDADFSDSPFLPSKIFDYLLFDKPMLGLTPLNSATARFLQRLGYAVVGPSDVEAIKDVLTRLLDAWRSGLLKPTAAHIEARRAYDVHSAGFRYVELVEALRQ
jgi:glycosyltransferase involved in cell wall biosynthesis